MLDLRLLNSELSFKYQQTRRNISALLPLPLLCCPGLASLIVSSTKLEGASEVNSIFF